MVGAGRYARAATQQLQDQQRHEAAVRWCDCPQSMQWPCSMNGRVRAITQPPPFLLVRAVRLRCRSVRASACASHPASTPTASRNTSIPALSTPQDRLRKGGIHTKRFAGVREKCRTGQQTPRAPPGSSGIGRFSGPCGHYTIRYRPLSTPDGINVVLHCRYDFSATFGWLFCAWTGHKGLS